MSFHRLYFSCKMSQIFLGALIILFSFKIYSPQIIDEEPNNISEIISPRIINGQPARLGDVPYQLAFKMMKSRYRSLYSTFCGGTLISPSKVVSAAHCFESGGSRCFDTGRVNTRTLYKIVVVAGNLRNIARYSTVDSLENGQWRRLSRMTYPPNYRFPRHDIAVGYTKRPFLINAYVAPIAFSRRYGDYTGQCLTSGYGRINKYRQSSILLWAHLRVMTVSWCSRRHRKNMRRFICVADHISDVDKGDSGGPLVCSGTGEANEGSKGILVGVTSGKRMRAGSFFTRVSSYASFVERGASNSHTPDLLLLCLIYGILIYLYFVSLFSLSAF